MKPPSPWSVKANEMLADGQWHEGHIVMREMGKLIPPGIAVRRAERNREIVARLHGGEPRERIVHRETSDLIRIGKRSILVSLVNDRVRDNAWAVDPWPVPQDGWRVGNWKVMDLRLFRQALSTASERMGIHSTTGKRLLLEDPPIPHVVKGRTTWITDVPAFDARVLAHLAADPDRLADPDTMLSMVKLSAHVGLSDRLGRRIRDEHPELPWHRRGRGWFLKESDLPLWEVVATAWKADHPVRGHAPVTQVPETPTFADPQLAEAFRRYLSGDTGAREEMFGHMRRVFHAADEMAGDA